MAEVERLALVDKDPGGFLNFHGVGRGVGYHSLLGKLLCSPCQRKRTYEDAGNQSFGSSDAPKHSPSFWHTSFQEVDVDFYPVSVDWT